MLLSRNGAGPSSRHSLLPMLQLCPLLFLLPLLSLTSASPIQVPDLTKCGLASDTSVSPPIITLLQNCCLPVQQPVYFSFAASHAHHAHHRHRAHAHAHHAHHRHHAHSHHAHHRHHANPHPPQTHVRRRAQSVGADVIAQYVRAYELMKALPEDDPRSFETQANVHCAFCNGAYNQTGAPNVELQVHFSWLFLPWHRWYLYFHERILAKLVGDPNFSLVYWNWDDQRDGGNVLPAMFARNGTSLYDARRDPAHQPPVLVDLVPRANASNDAEQIQVNLNGVYQGVVTANTATLFMGGAARTGTDLSASTVVNAPLGGSIENGIHNAIHFWTGNPNLPLIADMGTFLNASRDPVFYAHHSNVDRLWTLWHSLPGGNRQDHMDPDFLNAEFYFYDENAQLVIVTVRDALDNTKLGVSYEPGASDELWINYQPPPTTNGSAVAEAIASGVQLIGEWPANGTVGLGTRLVALVARPTGKKPDNTEEVLTIQGVRVPPRSSFTSLLVFVNLPSANNATVASSAEYVGSFNVVPSGKKMMTNVKLEIGDNLKRIGIDKEDLVVITLLVQGLDTITIQGILIDYESN